jgi:hypothetical protein
MATYAIGIGGSGARVLKSLVHLCAAGLGPDRLDLLFVDLDDENGNVSEAINLIQTYQRIREAGGGETRFLKTDIRLCEPKLWSPLGGRLERNLGEYFLLDTLSQQNQGDRALRALAEFSYRPEQLNLPLAGGFRAMPSIGAPVFADAVASGGHEHPWRALSETLSAQRGAAGGNRIFVCGSIFGGTGASGIPTVARLIRRADQAGDNRSTSSVAIGAALLLPYFTFRTPLERGGEVYAHSEDFLVQTYLSLKYYAKFYKELGYDRVYVLGDDERAIYPTVPFGGGQKNPHHFVELLAACAGIDFLSENGSAALIKGKTVFLTRHQADTIGWNDVPPPTQANVSIYVRAAFAYLFSLHPHLERCPEQSWRLRIPWVANLFEAVGLGLADEHTKSALRSLRQLSYECLSWLLNIQGKDTSGQSIAFTKARSMRFLDPIAVSNLEAARFDETKFGSLLFDGPLPGCNLDRLWQHLSAVDPRRIKNALGLGYFRSALFETCREACGKTNVIA